MFLEGILQHHLRVMLLVCSGSYFCNGKISIDRHSVASPNESVCKVQASVDKRAQEKYQYILN